MKKLMKILAGILVVLAVLIVFTLFWLDSTLLKGFNTGAPAALGVPASLQDLQFRPLRGKASLEGLHIGNPEGFKTDGLLDLASVSIRLDPVLAADRHDRHQRNHHRRARRSPMKKACSTTISTS